jgi:ATP-dependent exoDNAse (exonuclease V) alpha subunit
LAQLPLDIKIRQACDAGESLAELSEFQYLASRTLQQLDSLKIKVKIC